MTVVVSITTMPNTGKQKALREVAAERRFLEDESIAKMRSLRWKSREANAPSLLDTQLALELLYGLKPKNHSKLW